MKDLSSEFKDKKVLITGGLGMIGSTIAIKLVNYGASVTLVDSCIEPYGANPFNIEPIKDRVTINISDIRDKESIKMLVKNKDIIFNLAGQVSHNDSMDNPYLDADINYIGHLTVLECLRKHNPEAVILHAGSRLQFGKIEYLPVDEKHPMRPRTPYALNKTAAENTYFFYHDVHGVRFVAFRIANPYGPRSQMRHNKYSMVNWFIRQAMEGRTLKVFGDGGQIRDYIYVDDLAEAFIQASANSACHGKVFNVGSGEGTKFKDMAETIVATVGDGGVEYVPWPDNYINVETGDHITDISKIHGATGWKPVVSLSEGIKNTYAYYKKNKAHYWE